MEIRVLGPLEVTIADGQIDVRRPMERALLTLLAAEAGKAVPAGRLIDGLWGGSPPATATKTLQTYVHHLRSLLPRGSIATERGGYRLAIDPDQVDTTRFGVLIGEANRLVADDPPAAGRLFAQALELWRGIPFADAPDADALQPTRTKLAGLHLQAVVGSIEARLLSGEHEGVIPQLEGLVEEHPLREDLWGLLMLALYRSGRQAEALRAFTAARTRLVEELGIDPGPELCRLEARILAQDPQLLDTGGRTAEPPAIEREPSGDDLLLGTIGTAGDTAPDSPGRAVPDEQRLATRVLARLDGVDLLDDAMSADVAARVAADTKTAIELVLARFGATFTWLDGMAVLGSFGVPIAREDDAYRALRAALELRAAMHAHSEEVRRSWNVDGMTLRVSVDTRPVSLSPAPGGASPPDDASLRAMLETAGRGDVVVDDHTKRLMGTLFTWEELGGASSDGNPIWRVRAVRRAPDKARMDRRLRAPLVGREDELRVVLHAIESLHRGLGGVLVVSGDAGVGKTRLVEEVRSTASLETPLWLIGHCAAYAEAIPLWPFRDLLRSWLELGPDETELKTRVALQTKLAAVLPSNTDDVYPYLAGLLGTALDPATAGRLALAPEALQYRTFEVIADVMEQLAAGRPLVITVEDLHWADATSLLLLEQLLPLAERGAVLLLLTTRPDPDHASRRFIDATARRIPHLMWEISLGSLPGAAQHAMLAALVGWSTLPDTTAQRVLGLAEGNPFFLEELVGSLIDEGALVPGETGWTFDHDVVISVPETVEKVVQARVDRLDPTAHEVVTSASVLGRSFGLPLLQGTLGTETVLEPLQQLLRLDLLVEARRWPQAEYVFKHVLIQEAAYRMLSPERRQDLHRRAAGWLEQRHAEPDAEVSGLLARHWAAAGDHDRAIAASIRAGDLARTTHALDEAIEHYRTALPMLEARNDRRTMALVLFKLALALHTALRFSESNETYQQAFALWDREPARAATATLRFSGPPMYRPIDPIRSYTLPDMQLQMALFDRLVERWPDDTLVPSLAERWEISDDGLRYRFVLRPGLHWSDGRPITAEDAAYGVRRNLDPEKPGVSAAMLYVIEHAKAHVLGESTDPDRIGIEVIDQSTLEFRLVAPAPYFLSMLNRPDCGPQPRHAIERLGDDWEAVDQEVVSGAFHRTAHRDDLVVLERRPDHDGIRFGNVGRVEWRPQRYDDAIASYLAGDLDVIWISGAWDGTDADRLPATDVHVEPRAGVAYLLFDHGHPGVSDPDVRRGLAHGIDRAALQATLPGHAVVATGGLVPPALAGHTPDIAPRFDPELASALCAPLRETGPLRIAVPDLPTWYYDPTSVEEVAAMWRAHADVEVEVETVDISTWQELPNSQHGFGVFPSNWYPGYTDPEYFLRLLLASDAKDNFGRFRHRPFDLLIDRAIRERNERVRLELFHAADRMAVAEMVAVIPLSYSSSVSVRSPRVHGWWEFGKSWANFADLVVDPADH